MHIKIGLNNKWGRNYPDKRTPDIAFSICKNEGDRTKGFVWGAFNKIEGNTNGLVVGTYNGIKGDANGPVVGIVNSIGEGTEEFVFGKGNANRSVIGLLVNDIKGDANGTVVGIVGNGIFGNANGRVLGTVNIILEKLEGFVFGAMSFCNTFKGGMLGIINFTDKGSRGVQVGLLNIRSDAPWYAKVIPIIAFRWSDKKGKRSQKKE